MENNKSEKKKTLPLIYVLGMPVLFIIGNFMAELHLELTSLMTTVYLAVLIYPLTYFISGLIIRKTNYQDALRVMLLSLVSASLAYVVRFFALGNIDAPVMIYSFLSFFIGQLIFIYAYDFLIKIKKDTYVPVLLLFAIISVLDVAFFGTLVEGEYITLTLAIRFIYTFAFPIKLARETVEKKTKVKPVQETGK